MHNMSRNILFQNDYLQLIVTPEFIYLSGTTIPVNKIDNLSYSKNIVPGYTNFQINYKKYGRKKKRVFKRFSAFMLPIYILIFWNFFYDLETTIIGSFVFLIIYGGLLGDQFDTAKSECKEYVDLDLPREYTVYITVNANTFCIDKLYDYNEFLDIYNSIQRAMEMNN